MEAVCGKAVNSPEVKEEDEKTGPRSLDLKRIGKRTCALWGCEVKG